MRPDAHGLPLATDSDDAAAAFDQAIDSVAKYRIDAGQLVDRALAADPDFALGHCLKGYLALLLCKQASLPSAATAHRAGQALAGRATPRERGHLTALAAWQQGDIDRAIDAWEAILADHPTDLMALRFAHFNYFWLGRTTAMRASVARAAPAWSPALPGFGTLLAMQAFGDEECGDYDGAERAGRRAVELDPADLWATHAVAHALDMRGRHADGIAWLEGLAPQWRLGNSMIHHLWWHCALFHLERGDLDRVLALYDTRVRDLDSALVRALPDLYIDLQNAIALLWRLEHAGVGVGTRWRELADKAEARIGDHTQSFTLPHLMIALAADGRIAAAVRLVEAMRAFAASASGALAPAVGSVALPLCGAMLAHRTGEPARTLALMLPIRQSIWQLGGSHAQRDLFNQILVDAAVTTGRTDLARTLLAEAGAAWTIGAERVGYARARTAVA